MKKAILDILKAKFLISGDATKNWSFIIFISILAAIMIASSHSADSKVLKIAALNEYVKELHSEFTDIQTYMQRLKLESSIIKKVEKSGLFPSEVPPKKIIVKTSK